MGKSKVELKDVVLSNMYEIEAVIRLLEKKGLLTHSEVLEEIIIIKSEHDKNDKSNDV
ncbi:MAG: hypothetical protein ACOYN6_00940 [Ignavibacteria bacterium]